MKGLFHEETEVLADDLAGLDDPLALTDRACCCSARPAVTVIMPPTAIRPHPTDLLLCGHHFRVSRVALKAAGAIGYDQMGQLLLRRERRDTTPANDVPGL